MDMFPWVIIFKIKDTFFIGIDDMGIHVVIISFVVSPIGHMDMSMQKIGRLVFFNQITENLNSLMGKVAPVI